MPFSPNSIASYGEGGFDGLKTATPTRPGAGSPNATFPIKPGNPGESPIRALENNGSGFRRRSKRNAISRFAVKPTHSILKGAPTSPNAIDNRHCGPLHSFVLRF